MLELRILQLILPNICGNSTITQSTFSLSKHISISFFIDATHRDTHIKGSFINLNKAAPLFLLYKCTSLQYFNKSILYLYSSSSSTTQKKYISLFCEKYSNFFITTMRPPVLAGYGHSDEIQITFISPSFFNILIFHQSYPDHLSKSPIVFSSLLVYNYSLFVYAQKIMQSHNSLIPKKIVIE